MALMVFSVPAIWGMREAVGYTGPDDEPGWNGKAKMSGSEGFWLGCRWISSPKDIPVPEEVKEGWEKLLHSARIENEEKRQNILAQWRLQWQKEEFRSLNARATVPESEANGIAASNSCEPGNCPPIFVACKGRSLGIQPISDEPAECAPQVCSCRAVFWIESYLGHEWVDRWEPSSVYCSCDCDPFGSEAFCCGCQSPVYYRHYYVRQRQARICLPIVCPVINCEIQGYAGRSEQLDCSKTECSEDENCSALLICCPCIGNCDTCSWPEYPESECAPQGEGFVQVATVGIINDVACSQSRHPCR